MEYVPDWVFDELMALNKSADLENRLETYARDLYAKEPELAKALAVNGDDRDAARYPGLEQMYKDMKIKIPVDFIRREVRGILRRYVQDERQERFVFDFQEDTQLQRAAVELLKAMPANEAREKAYAKVKEKFAATPVTDAGKPALGVDKPAPETVMPAPEAVKPDEKKPEAPVKNPAE
jgi:hypothetical protein